MPTYSIKAFVALIFIRFPVCIKTDEYAQVFNYSNLYWLIRMYYLP
jgi:hypothetical protein